MFDLLKIPELFKKMYIIYMQIFSGGVVQIKSRSSRLAQGQKYKNHIYMRLSKWGQTNRINQSNVMTLIAYI